MKRPSLTHKYLSEPNWKSLSARHKVKDNGLIRAMSTCDKQAEGDEYDGALESLDEVAELAVKLRASKEVAANRDLCTYLDNIGKDVARARAVISAEKQGCEEAEAEAEKSEADEKRLAKAISTELLAGLAKAKTVECAVLVCVSTPVHGVMVSATITAKHRLQLTELTGSTKFLPIGACVFDKASSTYWFVMQKKDATLATFIQQAIKCHAATSIKVKIITRQELEAYQGAGEEAEGYVKEEEETYSGKNGSDEPEGGSALEGEPEEEPLLTGVRPFDISGSVGQGGKNAEDDVAQVQTALNRKGARLETDGKIGPKTVQAIREFQKRIGIAPDGLVEVGRKTATELARSGSGPAYAGAGAGGGYSGGSGGYSGGGSGGGAYGGGGGGGGSSYGKGGGSGAYSGGSKGGGGSYGGGGNQGGGYSGGGSGGGSQYGGGGKGGGQYGGGSSGGGQYGGGGGGQYGGGGGGGGQYGGGGQGGYGGSGSEYGGGNPGYTPPPREVENPAERRSDSPGTSMDDSRSTLEQAIDDLKDRF